MALWIITGLKGGGKSYYGCELLLKSVREGALVHTNLELVEENWEPVKKWPDQIVMLSGEYESWKNEIRPGVEGMENVVLVDEGALIFNSRDTLKEKAQKDAIFEFLVHSRHLGLDVYFISQHPKNIDVQLRRMAEGIIHCVKTERIPRTGWLLAMMPWFGQFRRHWLDQSGRTTLDSRWAKFDPEVGKLYRTHMTNN